MQPLKSPAEIEATSGINRTLVSYSASPRWTKYDPECLTQIHKGHSDSDPNSKKLHWGVCYKDMFSFKFHGKNQVVKRIPQNEKRK